MDRRSWTIQQDQAIRSLVQQFGVLDWTNISQKLKDRYEIKQRTGKQCRQRWYNHLNPQVNKKPWTNQQQNFLFDIHRKSGNKWKLMSTYFQGRTDNDIKNHFYSTLRRSLRRLNKFIGQKNSTTQMRQIKPSVLSTIMNYIYEQENCLQNNNIMNSLKDLPYLIFEFSNYKPVKSKLKIEDDEQIKGKINFIFSLINSANSTYQTLKIANRNQKSIKKQQQIPTSHQDQDLVKKQYTEQIDFIKYLPKKSYAVTYNNMMTGNNNMMMTTNNNSLNVISAGLNNNSIQSSDNILVTKKSKQKTVKILKKPDYQNNQIFVKCEEYSKDHIKQDYYKYHHNNNKQDMLNTDLIQQDIEHNPQFLIKKQQDQQYYLHQASNNKRQRQQQHMMQQIGYLRQRRISLQAHQDFMQDQQICDLQQPSQISGLYCPGVNGLYGLNGLDDLIVVGKQIAIHSGQQINKGQVKIQSFESNQNIDELIQMNYSN